MDMNFLSNSMTEGTSRWFCCTKQLENLDLTSQDNGDKRHLFSCFVNFTATFPLKTEILMVTYYLE